MTESMFTAPNYLKRSSTDAALDLHTIPAKKRRVHQHRIHHKQAIPNEAASVIHDDDTVQSLFTRSLGLVIQDAGFTGADPTAIESFRSEAEKYINHFLSLVTQSMISCRRSHPIPQDFSYALSMQNLTMTSLTPHLRPKIPADVSQPSLPTPPPEEALEPHLSPVLGAALSGVEDKKQKRYIPAQFPSFPSRHTYKYTAEWTRREEDPRKIREKATEEGRMGEEALRGLASSGAARSSRDATSGMGNSISGQKRRQREEMWEKMIDEVTKPASKPALPNGDMELDFGHMESDSRDGLDLRTKTRVSKADMRILVNYERPYWRKEAQPERPRLRQQKASLVNGELNDTAATQ